MTAILVIIPTIPIVRTADPVVLPPPEATGRAEPAAVMVGPAVRAMEPATVGTAEVPPAVMEKEAGVGTVGPTETVVPALGALAENLDQDRTEKRERLRQTKLTGPAGPLLRRARSGPCSSRKMSPSIQAGLLCSALIFMVSCGDREEASDRLTQHPPNEVKRIVTILQSEG
jgi:hypothetical protein